MPSPHPRSIHHPMHRDVAFHHSTPNSRAPPLDIISKLPSKSTSFKALLSRVSTASRALAPAPGFAGHQAPHRTRSRARMPLIGGRRSKTPHISDPGTATIRSANALSPAGRQDDSPVEYPQAAIATGASASLGGKRPGTPWLEQITHCRSITR